MQEQDLRLAEPQLLSGEPMVALSTDTEPTVAEDGSALQVGQLLILEDTGIQKYWTGAAWARVTTGQVLDLNTQLLRELRDLMNEE